MRSVRFRVTVVAATAVVLVLLAGSVVLVVLQRQALTAALDATLVERADALQALVEDGPLRREVAPTTEEGFVQLVDEAGEVRAGTPNARAAPLPLDPPAGGDEQIRTVDGLPVDDDAFRVLSRQVPPAGVLHVGTTYDVVGESSEALVQALLVTIPLTVAALAGLVWVVVGRVLRPVEDIRATAAAIGEDALDRRVPEPGTGDEVDRLAETVNRMLARLEVSATRQRRFVADASHELRSPLTRMRTALEVELAAPEPAWPDTGAGVLDDVREMQALVEDLLYLARADEGRLVTRLRPVDLDDLVLGEVARAGGERAGSPGIDISGVSAAHVSADPAHLARAVRNLLDNAVRHARSRVSLTLGEHGGEAVLTVADDGPGIAAEDAERVFDRFARLDAARSTDTGGAGLGLSIARDIAGRHRGTLRLLPSEQGAVFELRLPVADA